MPKAADIKKGFAVTINGKILLVRDITINNPSARGAATLYKMRFTDVQTGLKVEQTFKGDEQIETIDLERRNVSFSYQEAASTVFMDNENYEQYTFDNAVIEDELLFITEGIEGLVLLMVEGKPISLELPQSVEMLITETAPSIKGASATARTKPAQFATGLTIAVPEYIANGEKIKINVAEKKFMSRAE